MSENSRVPSRINKIPRRYYAAAKQQKKRRERVMRAERPAVTQSRMRAHVWAHWNNSFICESSPNWRIGEQVAGDEPPSSNRCSILSALINFSRDDRLPSSLSLSLSFSFSLFLSLRARHETRWSFDSPPRNTCRFVVCPYARAASLKGIRTSAERRIKSRCEKKKEYYREQVAKVSWMRTRRHVVFHAISLWARRARKFYDF